MRSGAAGLLVAQGDAAVEKLIGTLQSGDILARRQAAYILGQIKNKRAVAPLIANIGDSDGFLRREVVSALGNIADASAVGPLIERLRDSDAGVREGASSALVAIGSAAVPALITALNDPTDIRLAAAGILGQIKDVRAVAPLLASLDSGDAAFRQSAVNAIAAIGIPSVEPLIAKLQDNNISGRIAAARALGKTKDARGITPLIAMVHTEDTVVGHEAFLALQDMGPVALDRLDSFLLDAMKNQDLKTIASSYDYWVKRGDPATVPALIAAMDFYADAYGNFDEDGDVGIATCSLNCGNDFLRAAAISWGEGHAFQVIAAACSQVTQTSGAYTYTIYSDRYCGPDIPRWGNQPLHPGEVLKLWRGLYSW